MDSVFSGSRNMELDASSLFNENFNSNLDEPVPKMCVGTNIPDRPSINYTPTSNDSEHLSGFDLNAGKHWHYPTGVDLRVYQFVITERCLFQNCLVCIPTGMGKTLIAAVVLHNFLRWYPTGCVVFMAPTRPLVSQQMLACHKFTGLSMDEKQAIELTGTTSPQQRATLWNGPYRAFFLTPQVIANDLASGICPATSIRCIVIDEAHKATGNHAYCQVIRAITGAPYNHRQFRIVALSATPASDLQGAQALIANLLIAHLEVRTESSPDVRDYCHKRAIETIVVRLDPQLCAFKRRLCDLARPTLQRLCEHNALWITDPTRPPDPEAFVTFALVKARQTFMEHNRSSPLINVVLRDFRIATCLSRALQLLIQYGLRPVYDFLTNMDSAADLAQVTGLPEFITDLGNNLGTTETKTSMSQLPFVAGHPKLIKLRDVLIDHFSSNESHCHSQRGTRAIVFTQFRDSVADIMNMLKRHSPLLRPAVFVGKCSSTSANQHYSRKRNTQRDQLQVMQTFREGHINILISTCIGEEGLDVGQVDLIVCFDAHKSPARLIQRLGRTGRKRSGRVVVLLTEGREQSNFALSMARSNTVHNSLLHGQTSRQLVFYPHNPRMVPLGINPIPLLWQPLVSPDTPDLSGHKPLTHHRKKCSMPPIYFRFSVREVSAILSLGQKVSTNLNTFSQRYSVNKWIPSIREGFQTKISGPSTTTWHLVALLRLLELHRRGLTHAMYHVTGIRNIDMINPLSVIVPSMSQLTQNVRSTGNPSPPSLSEASSGTLQSIKPPLSFFRGLVSKTLMVDPRIDEDGGLRLPEIVSLKGITLDGLRKAFERMAPSGCSSCVDKSLSVIVSKSTVFDSAFGLSIPIFSKSFRLPSPVKFPPTKKLRTSNESENDLFSSLASDNLRFDKKLLFADDLDDFFNSG